MFRLFFRILLVDAGVYFIPAGNAAGGSIKFLSFATNKITQVTSSEKRLDDGLALSPDGRWILFTQYDQAGSELMLVDNFH